MATAEELELARTIRREFSKRPIDSTRLEITCIRGRIYLSGTLSFDKEQGNESVRVKDEVAYLVQLIQRLPPVKQVIVECRMKERDSADAGQTAGHDQRHGKFHDHGRGH